MDEGKGILGVDGTEDDEGDEDWPEADACLDLVGTEREGGTTAGRCFEETVVCESGTSADPRRRATGLEGVEVEVEVEDGCLMGLKEELMAAVVGAFGAEGTSGSSSPSSLFS